MRYFTAGFLTLTLIAAPGISAFAQAMAPAEEVVVIAPYLVQKKDAPGPNLHTKVMEVSTERHVSYADLDLTNPGDAGKLEQRINAAAAEACAQLDKEYPPRGYVPVAQAKGCVKSATDQALATARDIITNSKS